MQFAPPTLTPCQALTIDPGVKALLAEIGFQPIHESAIGVGIADEDRDGRIRHGQLFPASITLASLLLYNGRDLQNTFLSLALYHI